MGVSKANILKGRYQVCGQWGGEGTLYEVCTCSGEGEGLNPNNIPLEARGLIGHFLEQCSFFRFK